MSFLDKRRKRGPTYRRFHQNGLFLNYFNDRKDAKSYMKALVEYYRDNPEATVAGIIRAEKEKGIIIPRKVWDGEMRWHGIETRTAGYIRVEPEQKKVVAHVRIEKRCYEKMLTSRGVSSTLNSLSRVYCGFPLDNEVFVWIEGIKMFVHFFKEKEHYTCHFSSTPSKELIDVVQGLLNAAETGGFEVIKKFARSSGWDVFG